MPQTIEELKERYYKIVLEKGGIIYSLWGKNGTTSKQIVAKAYGYAFDKRIKTDGAFRFKALAFTYALGIRLEKRYRTFLRKLFRLFAFLNERAALKALKNVLGFSFDAGLREMIDVETEKLALLFSKRDDQNSVGGGKNSEMGELSVEEELKNFIEECALEDMQKEVKNDLKVEGDTSSQTKDDASSNKADNEEREKISVDETEKTEKTKEEKKEFSQKTKTEQKENSKDNLKEENVAESGKDKKTLEKSVANTSILAEMMAMEQERQEEKDDPFPIFKESNGEKIAVEKNDATAETKEQGQNLVNAKYEDGDRGLVVETEYNKDVIPIFKVEQGETINNMGEPQEKSVETIQPKEEKVTLEEPIVDNFYVSEENKARRAINLSEDEFNILLEQLKMAASIEMERVEKEWREKISIESSDTEQKLSVKEMENSPNKGAISSGIRK